MTTDAADTQGALPTTEAPPSDAGVRLAVLQYLLEIEQPPAGRVPCISVRTGSETGDPDGAVLEYFREAGAVPGSECRLANPMGGIIHTPSDRAAVLYSVSRPAWLRDDAAAVDGGYQAASLDGMHCGYLAQWADGRWTVQRNDRPCIVS